MGDIGRTEGRSAFRKLIQESVPANLQTRTLRLLDSIVFGAEPILRGLEYFEVRYGSGQPTTTDYPDEGYGVYINEDDDSAWVVLHWRGEFFVIGGSGSASLPVHTHDHETDLTNVGTNTHAQIDTHIGDSTIHFLSSTIDYALVSGNDGDTDITGAELEELTDGSTTALHNHSGGVGEANTASSSGSGTSVYYQKTGVDIELNAIKSENALLTVGLDGATHDIELTVNEGSINHASLTNTHNLTTDIDHDTVTNTHNLTTDIDHGGISGLADDDHVQYLLRNEWLQNGFQDRSDVDMDWDDGSRTLTIQPVAANFKYYYEGVLYTETGSITETIPDTEGLWVIYIDGEGTMAQALNPDHEAVDDVIDNECIVAYVYWDAANNDGRLMNELHGARMSPATHHYLHDNFGAQYFSGMALGDITVDQSGGADSHAQFSITAGEFYDEDIGIDTTAKASTDTWEVYYVDGSGNTRWVDAEATFPVYAIGGVIAYNNGGTLTVLASNKFCLYHVFATNIKTDANADYAPIIVPGEAQYNSRNDAQDAALLEIGDLTTGSWPVEETIPLFTVIYQQKAAASNGVEAAIVSTEGGGDYMDWRQTGITGSGGAASDHGALSGLSDDDHDLYLLASDATDRATFATNWTDLTDAGDTTLHDHDGITENTAARHAESHTVASHSDTTATGSELEELTDGSDTTLHDHDGISENTSARHDESHTVASHSDTTATGSELEELTDGSTTTLHNHSGGAGEANTASSSGSGTSVYYQKTGVDIELNAIKSENNRLGVALDGATHDIELTVNEGNIDHDALANTHGVYDYSDISGADAGTNVSAAELEELTDGSETTLHSHAGGGGASIQVFQTLKTGTQATTGSFVDITGWVAASPSATDISFNTTTGVVTFDEDGTYIISCWVKGDAASSNRCQLDIEMQFDSGSGYATEAGATDSQYNIRNTTQRLGSAQINNFALVVTTSAGTADAKFRMKDIGIVANVFTDAARITILKVA